MPFDNLSFFGSARRIFDPKKMFGRFGTELGVFFADYYCYGGAHRVCIVVSRKGTETYTFCRRYLKKLNVQENPFFSVSRNASGGITSFKINHNTGANKAFTEIVYTEDLDLQDFPVQEAVEYKPANGYRKAGCLRCSATTRPTPSTLRRDE
ncbi:hypothetical protein AAVH_12597 [Aphelenchoides avenae]|nr:hypothetical protein AAVH_12597 [Aphelenchus avenae]